MLEEPGYYGDGGFRYINERQETIRAIESAKD
jgi:hypothetical protein